MEKQDLAQAVLAEARSWLGTPYHHQASRRGAGTDCLGLIRGVWRGVYGGEPEKPPAYSMDWSEPSHEEVLMAAADRWLIRVAADCAAVGDVLLFRMHEAAVAKHLGIVSSLAPMAQFIHAYSGHGVVESALSQPWLRRVAMIYRFPERS